jgi:hypothetical protein
MFDKKDPVTMAMATLVVSIALLTCILYLAKPSWVLVVDQNTGKSLISWQLIISYSVTFALVLAIAVLLILSNQRVPKSTIAYDVQAPFPAPTMATAYCGAKH